MPRNTRGSRGGQRQGRQGEAKPNRTDMTGSSDAQPVRAAAGQTFGERGRQEAAQRVMPLPGGFGAFNRPSERPDEPLTAGAPVGPGPGPESVNMPLQPSPDLEVETWLRMLARQWPTRALLRLIETMDNR